MGKKGAQALERNPNWKGGRTISSHGYVLLHIGKGKHLANINGYAYEHRLVAEEKLGRELQPGEKIHHVNGNRQDNRPENIEVCSGNAEHYLRHRRVGLSNRRPGESNPIVQCMCGCGSSFEKYDSVGRPRRFVTGHNTIIRYHKENYNG